MIVSEICLVEDVNTYVGVLCFFFCGSEGKE